MQTLLACKKSVAWIAFAAMLFLLCEASYATNWLAKGEVQFKKSSLIIKKPSGQDHKFEVELAISEEQHDRGLMFRRQVASGTGMLFIFKPPKKVTMWMKDTYVPLDMVFIREDGIITKIIENTVPMDLTPLSSDQPVAGVIEMTGGETARRGINVGDLVINKHFSPEKADD